MTQPRPGPDAPAEDDIAAQPRTGNPLLWIIVLGAVLGFGIYVFNVTGGGGTAMPVTPASQPVGGKVPPSSAPLSTGPTNAPAKPAPPSRP